MKVKITIKETGKIIMKNLVWHSTLQMAKSNGE